ncbi:hypothetical protein ES703_125084 [subsurface metagenome]
MSDNKKVTEKANKEKVIGGADSYNPVQDVKDKKAITSPVEIKGNKYVIKPLSMLDVKKLNIEKRKLKKGDEDEEYDFGFSTLLYVIKKFNDNAKGLTIEDLQEMIDVDDFERPSETLIAASFSI